MKKVTLLDEILLELGIDSRNNLDELSQDELKRILAELIYRKEHNERNLMLVKKVLDKTYSEEEANFYYEIIEWMYIGKDKNEIINKYANGNYSNNMFCRTGTKAFWDIEAQILIKRGYPNVKDVLSKMFVWLQDLNWPGAMEISELLSSVDKETIIPCLEEVVTLAREQNDIGWLYWLRGFMEKNQLKKEDFKNKDIYELLEKSTDM